MKGVTLDWCRRLASRRDKLPKLRDLRALRGDPFDRAQGHPEEARMMTNCLTTKDAKYTKEEIQGRHYLCKAHRAWGKATKTRRSSILILTLET